MAPRTPYATSSLASFSENDEIRQLSTSIANVEDSPAIGHSVPGSPAPSVFTDAGSVGGSFSANYNANANHANNPYGYLSRSGRPGPQSSTTSFYHPGGMSQDEKYEIIMEEVHDRCMSKGYYGKLADSLSRVVITTPEGEVHHFPRTHLDTFERNVAPLKVRLATRVTSNCVLHILDNLPQDSTEVQLGDSESRIQILDALDQLPRARKFHFAAFIRSERCLVVWGDRIDKLLDRIAEMQLQMISSIWNEQNDLVTRADKLEKETARNASNRPTHRKQPSTMSKIFFKKKGAEVEVDVNEKEMSSISGDSDDGESNVDDGFDRRERVLWTPFMVACSWIVVGLCFGLGTRTMIKEYMLDGKPIHFAMLLTFPHSLFFGMFGFNVVVNNLSQLLGPVGFLKQNTKYFSAIAPKKLKGELPHITVQMPVYKESLGGVIDPTVQSILTAISTYELQGGSVNIFVNDDGMQLLDENNRRVRQQYYEMHNIGWVARPGHGVNGFIRAGKFKKASNMNFALDLSVQVERYLLENVRDDENVEDVYDEALAAILLENPSAWAAGDLRIGELILLIDSDTRVPEDCFMSAASEMARNPNVAVIQHSCGVMQVVYNFWENGITWFTQLVYRSIKFSCATGDIAPFVGHNAFLRWAAVQEVVYEQDGKQKWWSEAHVSEDFEMALKLQINGYITRLAAYHGDDFKEGVSLTVYDELNRWEKYAYGCSELMFHPFRYWFTRGPFTPLFRKFINSNMPGYAKFTVMAYVATYFALGSAWISCLANFFAVGWFYTIVDRAYLDAYAVEISCIAVFLVLSALTLTVYRYRIREASIPATLGRVLMWAPFFFIFFSGVSMHISQALLSHLCGINMTWGATAKELEDSNFWKEVPVIFKKFWRMYAFLIFEIGTMVALAYFVPPAYRISATFANVPLATVVACHFLLPLALNPQLMQFSF